MGLNFYNMFSGKYFNVIFILFYIIFILFFIYFYIIFILFYIILYYFHLIHTLVIISKICDHAKMIKHLKLLKFCYFLFERKRLLQILEENF